MAEKSKNKISKIYLVSNTHPRLASVSVIEEAYIAVKSIKPPHAIVADGNIKQTIEQVLCSPDR